MNISRRHLILASSSPRRQELIRTLNIPFEIQVSDVDETTPTFWSPAQVVEQLALRKAEKVREMIEPSKQGIIVGADTIVVQDYRVLGKPKDQDDAKWMLSLLQGKSHQVYSGIACIDAETGETHVSHRITYVSMKHLTDQQIDNYVASGEPLDKAGAYAIQGLGSTLVESIEGCYFNVVGLPLALLSDMLAKFGVEVL